MKKTKQKFQHNNKNIKKKSPYEQSHIKMLYFLNGDPEYYKKMKESTKLKYDFKQNASGKWE